VCLVTGAPTAASERFVYGTGVKLDQMSTFFGMPSKTTVGIDTSAQLDERTRHANLNGVRGALAQDQDEQAKAVGLFVVNDVQIAGASSTTSRSNDTLITSAVKTRLTDTDKVNVFHVKVVTEAAVVYLLGVVTEQEAAAAVEIARTTSGVRKVVKMFEYCKPDDEVCRSSR